MLQVVPRSASFIMFGGVLLLSFRLCTGLLVDSDVFGHLECSSKRFASRSFAAIAFVAQCIYFVRSSASIHAKWRR